MTHNQLSRSGPGSSAALSRPISDQLANCPSRSCNCEVQRLT